MPWNHSARAPDFAAIRRAVLDHVQSQPSFLQAYDFVLVDEGQDLEAVSFDLLRTIARHVTVAMDHKQQIYRHGSSESEILRRLGLKRGNVSLLDAFRSSPYITALAAELLDDPKGTGFPAAPDESPTEFSRDAAATRGAGFRS